MRAIELKKHEFIPVMVKMLYDWNKPNIHPYAEFITECLAISVNGMVDQNLLRPIVKTKLNMTDTSFRQTLFLLKKSGDIVKKVGSTLYLHPKYRAILECGDLFMITVK